MKFKECGKLLNSERFSLKTKGMVYQSFVRSRMLCRSETWCLRENEKAVLRRTERTMVRAMCRLGLGQDLMEILGLKETVVEMARQME